MVFTLTSESVEMYTFLSIWTVLAVTPPLHVEMLRSAGRPVNVRRSW